jgi:hypothetical protein
VAGPREHRGRRGFVGAAAAASSLLVLVVGGGAQPAAALATTAPSVAPLAGDWNGDGTSTVGAVAAATGTWSLRDSNSAGGPDVGPFVFGAPGWVPVTGDWNGDGTTTIGAVDPATATWYLRNANSPGAPDIAPFVFPGAAVGAPDTTPPTTVDDAPSGWLARTVVVHLTARDDGSGVAATSFSVDGGARQQGAEVTVSAPADHSNDGIHTIDYYSVDNSGNQEQPHSAVVRIDTTPPTIAAATTPAAGPNGWWKSDVTVTFTCTDTLSEVASCPAPTVLGEGAGQSASGTAADNAGNTAAVRVSGIDVDETAPALSGTPTTSANGNGWYSGDVTIHWTCSDGLSGIVGSCPADDVIGGEGVSLTASESVSDLAGNATAATSSAVNIDRTAPVVTFAGNAGRYAVDRLVAIGCSASDALSGVLSTTCKDTNAPAWSFGLGTTTLSAGATDKAGNVATARTSFTVTVSPSSLCTLTKQFVEASAAYESLPAPEQSGIDRSADRTCSELTELMPRIPPALHAVLLAAYDHAVQALVRRGLLTQRQATALVGLASGL